MIDRLIESPIPNAAGLRGEEGAEELIHRVRIDADAGVLHGHHSTGCG